DRCRVTDGTELRVLERAAPPIIHADPTDDVARSRLRERFVVVNDKAKSAVQEYPGRTNGVERPGTRLSPRHPRPAYVWLDVACVRAAPGRLPRSLGPAVEAARPRQPPLLGSGGGEAA